MERIKSLTGQRFRHDRLSVERFPATHGARHLVAASNEILAQQLYRLPNNVQLAASAAFQLLADSPDCRGQRQEQHAQRRAKAAAESALFYCTKPVPSKQPLENFHRQPQLLMLLAAAVDSPVYPVAQVSREAKTASRGVSKAAVED